MNLKEKVRKGEEGDREQKETIRVLENEVKNIRIDNRNL